MKQNELTDRFAVESSEMSRLLSKMECAGLIERSRDGVDKIVTLHPPR